MRSLSNNDSLLKTKMSQFFFSVPHYSIYEIAIQVKPNCLSTLQKAVQFTKGKISAAKYVSQVELTKSGIFSNIQKT